MTWEYVLQIGALIVLVLAGIFFLAAVIGAFMDGHNKRVIQRYEAGLPISKGDYDYRRPPKP